MADNPFITATYDDRAVIASFDRLLDRVQNPAPALKRCSELILLQIDRGFEQQKAPGGQAWAPNTPYTIAQKRARGQILKVLQATGRLRSSLTGQVIGNTLHVGTNVTYAAKNQLGQGVTKREFIGISQDTADEIVQIFDDYLTEN